MVLRKINKFAINIVLICEDLFKNYNHQHNSAMLGKIFQLIKKNPIIAFLFVLITITIIVYFDYLTLKKLYVFRDWGSDTYAIFWPHLQAHHRNLVNGEFSQWSFNRGLGQNIFPGFSTNPFQWIPILLGGNGLAFSLPYMQVLQIVLSGLFFYLYLRVINISTYSSIIGSMLYSFSGHMVLRGTWYHYANEVVIVALMLYAYELFYQNNNRWVFPLTSALLIIIRGPYHFFLYSFLIILYSTARYLCCNKADMLLIRHILRTASSWLIGLLLAFYFFIPSFINILKGVRVAQVAEKIDSSHLANYLSINSSDIVVTTFLRFFSADIMGVGSNFNGWGCYLSGPLFYSGLVCIVLLPYLFYTTNSKSTKTVYAVIAFAIIIYLSVPFFRYLMNAFANRDYRISSFWITVSLIIFSVKSLEHLINNCNILSAKRFLTKWLLLILALFLFFKSVDQLIDGYISLLVIIFLCSLVVSVFLVNYKYTQKVGKVLLMLLIVSELMIFSHYTVNSREAFDPGYLTLKEGYFDYSNEAISYLNRVDESAFFRLEKKDYNSEFLNDAIFQNYYSTKSYQSFNNKYYSYFLNHLSITRRGGSHLFINGFGDRFILDTFVGVKYLLVENKNSVPFGYTFFESLPGVHIFINEYSLPLGFCYDSYVAYEDFLSLPPAAKDIVLLNSFVLEGGLEVPVGIKQMDNIRHYSEKNYLEEPNSGSTLVEYVRNVEKLRTNVFKIEHFEQSRIRGSVSIDRPQLLFFSIPYDDGWHVMVNGEIKELELVNLGFIGVYLEPGDHEIELTYRQPYLSLGLFVSIFGIILYLGILYMNYSRKRNNEAFVKTEINQ